MTYNEECAKLWNPDPSIPLEYKVRRMMYSDTWDVMVFRGGLGIGVKMFIETKEEAEAIAKQLQEEYDNEHNH